MADLAAHGVARVTVFSLSDNRAVARMVARATAGAQRELDGPTATYRFATPGRVDAVPELRELAS